jgi:hypothetical protein
LFVEKYKECIEYCKEGLKKFPESAKIKELMNKALDETSKETKRIMEITTIQNMNSDKKYQVYKALREKGVKLGKKVHHLPEIVDVNIEVDEEGFLHFPVLILYDEYMVTDFF